MPANASSEMSSRSLAEMTPLWAVFTSTSTAGPSHTDASLASGFQKTSTRSHGFVFKASTTTVALPLIGLLSLAVANPSTMACTAISRIQPIASEALRWKIVSSGRTC